MALEGSVAHFDEVPAASDRFLSDGVASFRLDREELSVPLPQFEVLKQTS